MGHSAGIRILVKRDVVLWSDEPFPYPAWWHGFHLKRHDRKAKDRIVGMLRSMPKKWDRNRGQTAHIFALPEVTSSWY